MRETGVDNTFEVAGGCGAGVGVFGEYSDAGVGVGFGAGGDHGVSAQAPGGDVDDVSGQ